MLTIAEADPALFLRAHRGLQEYANLAAPRRHHQTQCIVYWGPPGSGKTRAAYEFDSKEAYFVSPPRDRKSSVWWDGYDGERTVILDDFYGWMQRSMVYRMVDRYPLRFEFKGGSKHFVARTVIFTSNIPIEWWWSMGIGAMDRRLEDPIGVVQYVGDDRFPTASDYLKSDYIAQFRPARFTEGDSISDRVTLPPKQPYPVP